MEPLEPEEEVLKLYAVPNPFVDKHGQCLEVFLLPTYVYLL